MSVSAGELRHLITIEQPTTEIRPDGSAVVTWSALARRYASITPVGGEERYQAATVKASLTHHVKIRRLDGLTSKMRIRYGSRLFYLTCPPLEDPSLRLDMILKVCEEV